MNFIKRHFKFTFCMVWFTYLFFCLSERPNITRQEMDAKISVMTDHIIKKMKHYHDKEIEDLKDLRDGLKKIALIQYECDKSWFDDLMNEMQVIENKIDVKSSVK